MEAVQESCRRIVALFLSLSGLVAITIPPAVAEEKMAGRDQELKIYMPYSSQNDHMVVGREIPGYQMRYDLAQESGIFMVLLPEGYTSLRKTPIYFAIDTLSLDGGSLKNLYEHDLQGIQKNEPGVKVLKRDLGTELTRAGTCLGAELRYPEDKREFSWERFFICKSRSKNYAIMMSLGARTGRDLEKHYRNFIEWADAPQIVTDHKVVKKP
jgi:hypothetical protein